MAGWTWVNGEGTFPGQDGQPIYSQWSDTGEPNDSFGPGSEQYLGVGFWGHWNDESYLSNVSGYVVEFQSVPDPTPGIQAAILAAPLGLQAFRTFRRR